MSSEDRARLRLVGGSQIASFIRCLQLVRTQESFMAWLEKQFTTDFRGNVYTEIGKICEELILDELPCVEESNKQRIHVQFRQFCLGSTPDAILSNGRIIEIKTKVRDRGTEPITAQHALQLIYYLVMNDKSEGSLLYYTPDRDFETLHLLAEYQVTLEQEDRDYFLDNLLDCCESMNDLLPGQVKKARVGRKAMVLYDYKRLFIKKFSSFTPILIEKWPTELDELMKKIE